MPRGLVCIAPSVHDRATLLNGIVPSLKAYGLSSSHPITQITERIQQHPTATELHLVAHGEPGTLHLGETPFNWQTIQHYAPQLQQWQGLNAIYLYSCNVAIGEAGSEFLAALHRLTGATIYASSSPVGHTSLSGNWVLDVVYGDRSSHPPQPTLAFSTQAQAAYRGILDSYKVTTLVDENDGGSGGTGLSLREAIAKANANPGVDKIKFNASLANGTITLTQGQLEITEGLEIKGLGADKLTISGNHQSRIFSVFDADETTNFDAVIEGLTLTKGKEAGAGTAIANGENLTLKQSVVTGNTGDGGGSYSGVAISHTSARRGPFDSRASTLRIVNTVIADNDDIGVYTFQGKLEIQNSVISGNTDAGIYNYLGVTYLSGATLQNNRVGLTGVYSQNYIHDSTVSNNGDGIEPASSSVIVTQSRIVDNDGAGVFSSRVEIFASTIANNGGVGVYGQGITVVDSTISGNGGSGIEGGYYRPTAIINSTISNNRDHGISILSSTGYDSPVSIFNSTITGNSADVGSGIFTREPQYVSLTLGNSIVAGNQGGSDILANVTSAGHNIIGNGDDSTGLIDGVNGDQVGTTNAPIDPRLGPLQDNGGLTQTHALLADSPAIDAGNNVIIPQNFPIPFSATPPITVTTDQRGTGFARIRNGNVDIGAFEVQSGVVTPLPGTDIIGTNRRDTLQGSVLGERIDGRKGNDRIDGNAGNDQIVGGKGNDDLTGGAGADTFIYESVGDRGDTLRDFEVGLDQIDLSEIFTDSKFAAFDDAAGRFENYVRLRQRPGGVSVEVDQAGDNGTNFVRMALVQDISVADLSISDFQLT